MITLTEGFTFLYFFCILLFLNSLSNFFFWILLELNMVIFICLFFYSNSSSLKLELYDFSLFYFIVQSFGSICFLFGISESFIFSSFSMEVFLVFSLCLKSAIFPFSWWLLNSGKTLSSLSVSFLLSFQKIPIFLFLFNMSSTSFFLLALLSLFYGMLGLLGSTMWFELIFFSSLYSTFWIYTTYTMSSFLFLHFFVLYTLFLLIFCKVYSMSFQLKFMDSVTCSLIFMFFLGLPPLSSFFFKFYFIGFCFNQFGVSLFFTVWLVTFFSLFGYFKFLYEFFFPIKSLYKISCSSSLSKNLVFLFGLGISPQIFFFSSKLY